MYSLYLKPAILIWLFFHAARGRELPANEILPNFSDSLQNELMTIHKVHNSSILASDKFLSGPDQDSKYSQLGGFPPNSNFAAIYSEGNYKDVAGMMNIFYFYVSPIKEYQLSSNTIWLFSGMGGPANSYNVIQFGCHVYPKLYGDPEMHFFVSWTSDGYQKTGCYNTMCEGFVVNPASKIEPGSIISVSQYGGLQYYHAFRIKKDPAGKWLIYFGGDQDTPIGYYPTSIFNNLNDHASSVMIGGLAQSLYGDCMPPMGSGHFGSEGDGHAAQATAHSTGDDGKSSVITGSVFADNRRLYTVEKATNAFFYGGPGGC